MRKTLILRFVAITGLIVSVTSGCSVGGQYGYSTEMAATASVLQFPVNDFEGLTRRFLDDELGSYGMTLERLNYRSDYVPYIIRGLKGYVVHNSEQWELIQVSFTLTRNADVAVSADGWLASGINYPLDSQFTTAIEPHDLDLFTQKLAGDLRYYIMTHGH